MSLDKRFIAYIEKLFNYCPYLKKSLDNNLLYTVNYIIKSADEEEISKYMFYYSLLETEKI